MAHLTTKYLEAFSEISFMSNDAIVVKPSIQFLQPTQNTQPSMDKVVVDSTEYDLNRTVARQDVATSDSNKLEAQGFHKLYYFETEESLLDAVKQFSVNQNDINIDDFEPASTSKDKTLFALVFGRVGFQATDKFIPIANPVYRVYPSSKSGNYLDFSDIRDYIQKGWLNAFHKAITLNTTGASITSSDNPSPSQNLLTKGAALGVFGALLLFLFGVGISQAFAYFNKAPASSASYSSAELTGVTTSLSAPTTGTTPQQALYESESDKLLKQMNINLDDNRNIGCFTK